MYFDPTEFDFDSLSDVIGLNDNNTKQASTKPTSTYRTEQDDISDLLGNRTEPDETEYDYNNDTTDLHIPDNVDLNSIEIDALNDERPINFEGMRLTAKEVKELYKAKNRVDNDSSYFAEQAQRFSDDNKIIQQRAFMNQNVIEKNITTLRDRLNNPSIQDFDYGQTAKELLHWENILHQHNNEVNSAMTLRAQQEQQINGYRIRAADMAMSDEYPQWNSLKTDVLNYAQSLNIPGTALEKVYDKGIMTALFKSMLYDHNKSKFENKAKETSKALTPTSMSGAKSSTRNTSLAQAEKQQANKVIAQMGSSRQSNIDAFKYIKDAN